MKQKERMEWDRKRHRLKAVERENDIEKLKHHGWKRDKMWYIKTAEQRWKYTTSMEKEENQWQETIIHASHFRRDTNLPLHWQKNQSFSIYCCTIITQRTLYAKHYNNPFIYSNWMRNLICQNWCCVCSSFKHRIQLSTKLNALLFWWEERQCLGKHWRVCVCDAMCKVLRNILECLVDKLWIFSTMRG